MLDYSKARKGSFTQDEKETIIIIDGDNTVITTSQTKIVNKVINQYAFEYNVEVLYYGVSTKDGSQYPTEVRVTIPLTNLITLRSLDAIKTKPSNGFKSLK